MVTTDKEPESEGLELSRQVPDETSTLESAQSAAATPEEDAGGSVADHAITALEFLSRRRTSQVVYVFDLRDQEAFDAGNLAGSYSLPIEHLENNLHRLPFSGDMLFYDGGEGTVLQAASQLLDNAFPDFSYIEEGYEQLLEAMASDPGELKFDTMDPAEQAQAIEKVLDEKVRDFLASDGGGLEVVAIDGDKVMVAYQGACGSCPSSTAGTLRFIQSSLTLALNHPIEVVPTDDM